MDPSAEQIFPSVRNAVQPRAETLSAGAGNAFRGAQRHSIAELHQNGPLRHAVKPRAAVLSSYCRENGFRRLKD